jgi:hypothetical protein
VGDDLNGVIYRVEDRRRFSGTRFRIFRSCPSRAARGRDANSRGTIGDVVRPPHGDPPHHYHFQVFALDAPLALRAGADRGALAAGEVVGTFQRP